MSFVADVERQPGRWGARCAPRRSPASPPHDAELQQVPGSNRRWRRGRAWSGSRIDGKACCRSPGGRPVIGSNGLSDEAGDRLSPAPVLPADNRGLGRPFLTRLTATRIEESFVAHGERGRLIHGNDLERRWCRRSPNWRGPCRCAARWLPDETNQHDAGVSGRRAQKIQGGVERSTSAAIAPRHAINNGERDSHSART